MRWQIQAKSKKQEFVGPVGLSRKYESDSNAVPVNNEDKCLLPPNENCPVRAVIG